LGRETVSTSIENVKRLAVTKQHFSGKLPRTATPEDILSVMGDIGYVQLWGENLIGRADMRMDRENGKLLVNSLYAERRAPGSKDLA
jgi:uncharacterized protein YcaQ